MSKILREIKPMPQGVVATIVEDVDSFIHILEISDVDFNFSLRFNINWLEHDLEQLYWLAYVLGRSIQDIYLKGRLDESNKIYAQVKGAVDLITKIQKEK
jgi:hypothetical protein